MFHSADNQNGMGSTMTTATEVLDSALESSSAPRWNGAKLTHTTVLLVVGTFLWFMAPPSDLTLSAWHLLIIFLGTIAAVILKPLPIGAISFIALTICIGTETLTLKQSLTAFSSSVVWLVVLAFFLSMGFKVTGLGKRIAYFFLSVLGSNTLGLSYGFVLTELFLAPFVPSNTARGAGILFPIVSSLAKEQGSCPTEGTQNKMGAFLIKVCFHVNMVTSAMFMTGLVGNPLIVSLAANVGVQINWMTWALAAIIPGLVNITIIPLVLYRLYPPEVMKTPEARSIARTRLRELGPLNHQEIIMLSTFAVILALWVFGSSYGIKPTTAAFIGFSALLFTGVLKWKDCIRETTAWETLMWFAPLLMMATYLTEFGAMNWFSKQIEGVVSPLSWPLTLAIICLIYFYIHYLFASVTARITALYSTFLIVLLAAGTPPMLAAMSLAVLSALSGPLTHFGTGTAPVYFGANYVPVKNWWHASFVLSLVNLGVWTLIGGLWWKVLGYW